jgi:hypothetical protein
MITDFATLKTEIIKWIAHDDVDDTVAASLIQLFESDFNMSDHVRNYYAETRVEHVVPAGETHKYVTLPTDWNGGRALRRNCYDMQFVTPEQMSLLHQADSCPSLEDGFYTIENQALFLYPSAGENTAIEILYWQKLTALDDTNTTNWLVLNFPQVYLFGCLLLAGTFVKSDLDMQRVGTMYDRALKDMRKDTSRKKYGGGTVRMRNMLS